MAQKKEQFYKQLKIMGMLSFVPIVLFTGPLAGFFVGEYLRKKFGFVPYTTIITMAIGFIASISETVRIIKLVYTIANTDKRKL